MFTLASVVVIVEGAALLIGWVTSLDWGSHKDPVSGWFNTDLFSAGCPD